MAKKSNDAKKPKPSKKKLIELIAYSLFCIIGALYCYHLKGVDGFVAALTIQESMLLSMLPRIIMALGVASILWVLLDPEKLKTTIQKRKGWVKVAYATILGAVTPGGPSSSFSILNMFLNSGLGYLIGITYITAWSMLGVQRILIWDIPLMGTEQAGLRFLSGFWLPAFAGLMAAWMFDKNEGKDRP